MLVGLAVQRKNRKDLCQIRADRVPVVFKVELQLGILVFIGDRVEASAIIQRTDTDDIILLVGAGHEHREGRRGRASTGHFSLSSRLEGRQGPSSLGMSFFYLSVG